MTPKRILPVALFAALLVVPTARAQDEPVLPDLTPREVEIRGELTIRFPSLRRQPLVGFNPPPRIPDIAADRRPFAEPYKQERADLPLSPLRTPTAPAVASYLDGPVFVGQVEGGIGRYTERFVLADLAARPGSALIWTVDGAYRGRDGFEAYPEAEASYEQGDFSARIVAPLGGIDVGASMEGVVSRYALYGVVPTFENLDAPLPERDVRGGTVGASLGRNRGTVRVKVEGALGASSIRTDVAGADGSLERGAEREDRTTSMSGSLETIGQTLGVWLAADYAKTTPVEDSTPSAAADGYSAGGGVKLEVGRIGRLSAGVRVLGVGRDALSDLEDDRSFSYLSPEVRLDAAIGPNLRLEVSQRPGTTGARLRDLYGEQPYLVDSPIVEPEIWPVDAQGRLVAALGRVELAIAAGYRRSPNRRYFEHDPTNVLDFVRGISTARHGKSREADAAVDVIGYFGPSVQAGIGATVRSARLTDLDADVPYVAPWTLRSLVSAAFLDGRGLVQATMRIEGPRDRDLAGSLELPAFADLDFLASYRVTRNASVVFRLDNVGGNRPEWDRYLRPTAVYTAGLAWEW